MSVRYVEMKEPIYDTISKRIRESFPNSCIIWIEENENTHLYEQYQIRKKEIAKVTSINEMQWFHGTREENITKIAIQGFDPTFNKASAYGKGTYFAKNASYSNSYMIPNAQGISFMFLCDVLMGKPCMGRSGLEIDTSLYHSAVDNFHMPTIVVSPLTDASYPRYIIAFHKNAV